MISANVHGKDLAAKSAAFYAYDRYDSQLPCYTAALRKKDSSCDPYTLWLARSYKVTTGPLWN